MKIQPFSNATEFANWKWNNCDTCTKNEETSTKRNQAGCALAFDLDLASVTDGEIPLDTAEWIGYIDGNLVSNCRLKDIEFKNIKIDRTWMFQQRLF